MKNFIFLFLIHSIGSFAQTSFKPEIYSVTNYQNGKTFLVTSVLSTHKLANHPRLALNSFVMVNPFAKYGEALFGPSYVRDHFAAGIMVGVETDKKVWRISPWLFLESDNARLSLLTVYEHGSSGGWFNIEGKYLVTKPKSKVAVRVGAIARRFHGVGPRTDFSFGKFNLYVVPVIYNWENKSINGMLGISARL